MSLGRAVAEGAPLGAAEFAAAFGGLASAGRLLVAVSGGPDSVALMGGLAEWASEGARMPVATATVDHGLRAASRAEAEGVGALAERLGLSHAVLTWSGPRREPVSQASARDARYRLLLAHAGEIGATHLLTAHTLDDQAETVLLRLAAGSGLSGLAAMRPEVALGGLRHARPLLAVSKARLVATCCARGWPFVEDPSNGDRRFARVRLRREIMPLLAAEGLSPERLARLAARLGRADEALERATDAAIGRLEPCAGPDTSLPMAALAAEPPEVALRVLGRLVRSPLATDTGPQVRLQRLEECLEALLQARRKGLPLRRTLAGRLLQLDAAGLLTISPEAVRRRGRRQPVTPIEIARPPSLGREPGRP